MNVRKPILLAILTIPALILTGCDPAAILEEYISARQGNNVQREEVKERVYMDEEQGTLEDFTGSTLTLKTATGEMETFDVSDASLECEEGIITGDDVSVIYEGRLEEDGAEGVHVLKVVDEYYHREELKDQSVYGQILELTCNTIQIESQMGNTMTFPITGVPQYYQNGARRGSWVYIHYKGVFPEADSDSPQVLDGSHMKVVSISDQNPFKAPGEGPLSATPATGSFRAIITGVDRSTLSVSVESSGAGLSLSMSEIPCYFDGGTAPGSHVTVTYSGDFDGRTAQGFTVTEIRGEDVETLKEKNINFTVSGTVTGTTANTVTIRTGDGALLTCYTTDAADSSTGGMEEGASIRITFNPALSRDTNIYSSLKIEDA